MDLVKQAINFYKWSETFADPRVANWFLMSSPLPTFAIILVYYLFVLVIGPRLMEKRSPIDFGWFLPAYNFSMVALNFYIVKEALIGAYHGGYSIICTPLRSDSYDQYEMMVAKGAWWYYVSKIIELFDTVLFTLRKRNRQISFLHVYHHSTLPFVCWAGAKWVPGGELFFAVVFNSSVHVVMYIYYGLAAMGPKVKKYLWWKKYLTMLQLVQFCSVITHGFLSLYVKCPAPVWIHVLHMGYQFTFILLFGNFYVHAYIKKSQKLHSSKIAVTTTNGIDKKTS